MAILRKRSHNGFTGKKGKTVIYPLKGQLVERGVGEISKPASRLQLPGRQVTTLVTNLLKPVMPFIRIGFKLATEKTTSSPYNLASSLNRLYAIKGIYPNQQIDFTKVIFSKGQLPVNEQIQVKVDDFGIQFSWDPDFLVPGMKATDQVMVMAYCPEQKWAFCITDGSSRKDGSEHVNIPKYTHKLLYHIYITFIASNRNSISDSLLLGHIFY